MNTSSEQPTSPPPSKAQSSEPTVSGTWQYNGVTLRWETSDPYSVTVSVQGAPPQTLTRTSPRAALQGAPVRMEAMLQFSQPPQQRGVLVLAFQLSPDIVFRVSLGGWSISTTQPPMLSPWWPTPEQPFSPETPGAPAEAGPQSPTDQ
jgi:hypothetical protein